MTEQGAKGHERTECEKRMGKQGVEGRKKLMTRIKCCGLTREEDIQAANEYRPEYIGFVFAKGSRRYVSADRAAELKKCLDFGIISVGVFVNEQPERVAELLNTGLIDMAQLHGTEGTEYIGRLRHLTDKPLIKAWKMISEDGRERRAARAAAIEACPADYILLDSGSGGTGECFNWELAAEIRRPLFLAGGLDPGNVKAAVELLRPFAVDVSSGIERNGCKDRNKMREFIHAVRSVKEEGDTI